MSKNTDPVSPELRKVETELDNAFRKNHLATLSFAQAAWYLLATAEDADFISMIRSEGLSIQNIAVEADWLITNIQYPLGWLYKTCTPHGTIPFDNKATTYKAAQELFELAVAYKSVVAAFTYATKGIVDLNLDGKNIISTHRFLNDTRYEAYNRLLKPSYDQKPFRLWEIFAIVDANLSVQGDRFEYRISAKIAKAAQHVVRPLYEKMFTLPLEWKFTRYSVGQYLDFATTLGALASIHAVARFLAAQRGCVGLGYRDSIKIFRRSELVSRITHYSGLHRKVVEQIVGDLEYGNRDIRNPDPALQPLIPITKKEYALAPGLWLGNAIERNFTVLMNRLSAERAAYAELVNDKENIMRDQMLEEIRPKGYRFAYGSISQDSSLPDIDLAIVSDAEKTCLILELKWFIHPADIGEVVTKTQDLQKGVEQINRIRQRFSEGFQPLLEVLGIDHSFVVGFAVVSANWIGFEDVQDPNVPIINQKHLTKKIQSEATLLPVIDWLNERKYLPTEGVEYEIVETVAAIDEWKLTWYGIKPLINHVFLPV